MKILNTLKYDYNYFMFRRCEAFSNWLMKRAGVHVGRMENAVYGDKEK